MTIDYSASSLDVYTASFQMFGDLKLDQKLEHSVLVNAPVL